MSPVRRDRELVAKLGLGFPKTIDFDELDIVGDRYALRRHAGPVLKVKKKA